MKTSHILFCAALLVVGVVLISAGWGAVWLLPVLLCGLMIGVMIWVMTRPSRDPRGDR